MKHVYNGAVAETFLRDALFGADRTIPVEERVDSAVKRVQKLTTEAKATMGQSGRGGSSSVKRGGGRRGGFINYNGANNSSKTETKTSITGWEDPPHLVVTTVRAALVATILVEVAVTESALPSFVAPPGIKPNRALRQANTLGESLKENICYKAMSCS